MLNPESILIIGVVALVIFGPKKLPELGRGLGQGLREFKNGMNNLKDQLEHEPPTPRVIEHEMPAVVPVERSKV